MRLINQQEAASALMHFLIFRRRQIAIELLTYLEAFGQDVKQPLAYLTSPDDDQGAIARALYFFRAKEDYDTMVGPRDNPVKILPLVQGGEGPRYWVRDRGAWPTAQGTRLHIPARHRHFTGNDRNLSAKRTVRRVVDRRPRRSRRHERNGPLLRPSDRRRKPAGYLVFDAFTDANGHPLCRTSGSQNHPHDWIAATLNALGMNADWVDHSAGVEAYRVYCGESVAFPNGVPTTVPPACHKCIISPYSDLSVMCPHA